MTYNETDNEPVNLGDLIARLCPHIADMGSKMVVIALGEGESDHTAEVAGLALLVGGLAYYIGRCGTIDNATAFRITAEGLNELVDAAREDSSNRAVENRDGRADIAQAAVLRKLAEQVSK